MKGAVREGNWQELLAGGAPTHREAVQGYAAGSHISTCDHCGTTVLKYDISDVDITDYN
jgi:hypothetical protein